MQPVLRKIVRDMPLKQWLLTESDSIIYDKSDAKIQVQQLTSNWLLSYRN